jgi:hypothetical protein
VAEQAEVNSFLVELVDESFSSKVQSWTKSSISGLLDASGFTGEELVEKFREAPYELSKSSTTEDLLSQAVGEALAEFKPPEIPGELESEDEDEVEPPALVIHAPPADEITDEIYAELGQALAEDLVAVINVAEPQVFEALLKDDEGLWAAVRASLLAELAEQDVTDISQETIKEAMRAPAWQAITDAFTGMWEAMRDEGGYEWLLTRPES